MKLIDIVILIFVFGLFFVALRKVFVSAKKGQCACCSVKNKKPDWVNKFHKDKGCC